MPTNNRVLDYGTGKSVPSLPTVEQCIKYLNDLGWNTVIRTRGSYAFKKEGAPLHLTPMWFSLRELRDVIRYGF